MIDTQKYIYVRLLTGQYLYDKKDPSFVLDVSIVAVKNNPNKIYRLPNTPYWYQRFINNPKDFAMPPQDEIQKFDQSLENSQPGQIPNQEASVLGTIATPAKRSAGRPRKHFQVA